MDFEKLMEYQLTLQKRLRAEQKVDRKLELLSLINQLTAGPGNIVQKEHILIEATERGFSENEIENLLGKLISENILFEQSPGFIKKR